MRASWSKGWALWLACALAGTFGWSGSAPAQSLRVELLSTRGHLDGPPAAVAVARRVQADAPGDTVRLRLPAHPGSHWLRLTSDRPLAAGDGRLLVVLGAQSLGTALYYPPGAPPRAVPEAAQDPDSLLQHGWVLPLPNGWPPAAVAYLRLEGATTEPLRLRLASAGQLAREQRAHSRAAIAAFTVLALMALVIATVWLLFRDAMYLSYAGYLACFGVYTLLLSGDAAEMPLLAWLARAGLPAHWAVATAAVTLQLVFSGRFLELDRLLPRGARLLRVLVWLHVGLIATLLLGRSQVEGWFYLAGNGLLVACVPTVLTLAWLAWRRGAVYGGYYLCGWTPLMAMAGLAAANQLGLVRAPWAEALLPASAVLEAAVLTLALAHHAVQRHRIALLARQSTQRDAMTGALNTPALLEMLDSWARIGGPGARGYGVLMVALDDFDQLASERGRVMADALLQQALIRLRNLLRPDDTIARLHDDRLVVVTQCTRGDGEQVAQRLVASFARRAFRIDAQQLVITASIAVARSRRGESAADLLQRAEAALAQVRDAGGNAVAVAHAGERTHAGELTHADAAAAAVTTVGNPTVIAS